MVAESRRTIGYTRSYTHTHTRLGLMHTTERTHKHKYAHAHSLKQSFLPVTLNQLYNFSHEILNTLFVSHVQLHGDAHTHTQTHTRTWIHVPSYPNTSVLPHLIINLRT